MRVAYGVSDKHTPNYMIRLETGRTKMECRIVTGALKYLARLQGMEEDRFPRICLERLKNLDRGPYNNKKYNWYTKLREELEVISGERILQLNREEIIQGIPGIKNKMETRIYLEDQKRALRSRYCPIYKYIKDLTRQNCEEYLKFGLPMTYSRTIAQLRMSARHETRICDGKGNTMRAKHRGMSTL